MSQLAFALDIAPSAAPTPTPAATGRAVRSPDRRPVPRPQPQIEEPTIAVDFTRHLSPEDMQDVREYAASVAPQLLDRASSKYEDAEERDRHLLKYAAGMALTAAMVLATVERKPKRAPATSEPQAEIASAPEKPVRAPGRPPTSRDPRSPRASMPPQALRARAVVESEAPVPAGPRRQQPSVEEVLTKYRGLKPSARRAQGGEG